MLQYIVRRILLMIPTLLLISFVTFVVVQLPPGDYLNAYVAALTQEGGETVDREQIEMLRQRYGLDEPFLVQYWYWISNIVFEGDFGRSFQWNQPVSDLLWGRIGLTFAVSLASLLFVYVVAFPIGVYSAIRKYSLGDYVFTFLGFIGLAVPNFLLALVLMVVSLQVFGVTPGGLFSPDYASAPWSWGKFVDFLAHLWVPMIIIGTASTAALIRVMRANLLDELNKPYVETARAKGQSEAVLIMRYPVRIALNPFVSRLGWELPALVSGAAITSIVLNLPTAGPVLLTALQSQDMYLAGSFILILSTLTVIGTLVSDILLAWLDPRIRYS
ncbi:MAG: ABC transporter permease [Roseitalea sp.]|nr:ABC transporter permease [Roseitalea sp.]MBO6720366.1 ABC transporter permease [Roseitalea sp.]MBO6742726.1 ABC transporter permease [Roseitalea sp.]